MSHNMTRSTTIKKILLLLMLTVVYFQCCTAKTNEDALQSFISDFMHTRSETNTKAALALIPLIVRHSESNDINPLLTAFIISLESSFLTDAVGENNDTGLMQVVKGGVCARGQDLTTADGQIKAGVECLARARDSCDGSLKQMLTMYASGKCVSKSKRTQRKIEWRLWKFDRIKNGKD